MRVRHQRRSQGFAARRRSSWNPRPNSWGSSTRRRLSPTVRPPGSDAAVLASSVLTLPAMAGGAATAARGRWPSVLAFLGDEQLQAGRDLGVELDLHLVLAQGLDRLV